MCIDNSEGMDFTMNRQLRNYTEDEVRGYLDKWFSEADVCHCDGCRLDVMAIMLNNLPPHYVVTDQGALYAQMDDFSMQHRVDMMSTMAMAAQIVKARPRHKPSSPSSSLR